MTTTYNEKKTLCDMHSLLVRAYSIGYTTARLNSATREEARRGTVDINGVTFTLETIDYIKAMVENMID